MGVFTDLTDEQIVHRALETERELVTKRFQHKLNRLENHAQLGDLRRDIARLQTEARRREIAASAPKGTLFARHKSTFTATAAGSSAAPAEKGGFLSGIVDRLTAKE
jgi:large subunit ribosomal protein L29